MRRSRYIEARTRAGQFSLPLAWFGLLVAAAGVLVARYGSVGPQPVLAIIGAGWVISALALGLAIVGVIAVWREGLRGAASAFSGLLIACLALLWPLSIGVQIWRAPGLAEITTDTQSPPEFLAASQAMAAKILCNRTGPSDRFAAAPNQDAAPVALFRLNPLCAKDGLLLTSPPANQRALQDRGQIHALSLFLDQPPAEALKAVEIAARALGWSIVAVASTPDGVGQVDAVAKSDLLRFPQFVAARVRPTADGSQLDVRVVSAFGQVSPGASLRRIIDLHETLQGRDGG